MGAQPERTELLAYSADTLIAAEAKQGMYQLSAFVGDDGEGCARYLHNGRRPAGSDRAAIFDRWRRRQSSI